MDNLIWRELGFEIKNDDSQASYLVEVIPLLDELKYYSYLNDFINSINPP